MNPLTTLVVLVFLGCSNFGCTLAYIVESGIEQSRILLNRVPVEDVLKNPKVKQNIKNKLVLAGEAKKFAINTLGLDPTNNYSTYVNINRPYLTWIVRAADKFSLAPYEWWFPITGKVPYKGFFKKKDALAAAKNFNHDKYDTYVRGASAYSTLGWFEDPIISSMLDGEPYNLVELIIHESVHATIYIKNDTDFNEQIANFIALEGTKMFYMNKEGENSPVLKKITDEANDRKIFSTFISKELDKLEQWYKKNKGKLNSTLKEQRLSLINKAFNSRIKNKLKTNLYSNFDKVQLNNAKLLSMKTYIYDLSQLEKLFNKLNKHMPSLVANLKNKSK